MFLQDTTQSPHSLAQALSAWQVDGIPPFSLSPFLLLSQSPPTGLPPHSTTFPKHRVLRPVSCLDEIWCPHRDPLH